MNPSKLDLGVPIRKNLPPVCIYPDNKTRDHSLPIAYFSLIFTMKRSRVEMCYICTGKWSKRKFHAEKREFDKIAPERDVSSHSPLTGPQRDFLRKHFCDHEGRLDTFCIKYCAGVA